MASLELVPLFGVTDRNISAGLGQDTDTGHDVGLDFLVCLAFREGSVLLGLPLRARFTFPGLAGFNLDGQALHVLGLEGLVGLVFDGAF